MKAFEYVNPESLEEVPSLLNRKQNRKVVIIAGGVDLLGEMKDNLIAPDRLINLKSLPALKFIKHGKLGLKIGATTTLSEIILNQHIQAFFPGLIQAAESVGSLQIRNVGTIGGNLCQRPRCWYFRNEEFPCLKKGGYKCYAVEGNNKYHAIFGGGPSYIVHPSDLAPVLIALNGRVEIFGQDGSREVALEDFYVLPEENIRQETILKANEVVTSVIVPVPLPGTKSVYLKFKEKGSMDFALSSVAVTVQIEGDFFRSVRVVLGGVAPKPWRAFASEEVLLGKPLTEGLLDKAAEAALSDAHPLKNNAYKVQLTRTLIRRAVRTAVG